MKSLEESIFEQECDAIVAERRTYRMAHEPKVIKLIEYVSSCFYFLGLIALVSIPFTDITLLHATCLFVIHYTIGPSDMDMAERVIKGATEDLAHIRANVTVIRKHQEKSENQDI